MVMLSGLDVEIVGFWHEVVELYCPGCAAKRLGELRAERIRVGLEQHEWEPASRYSIEEAIVAGAEDGHGEDGTCWECGEPVAMLDDLLPA
jgi:hypothetical protein